MTIATVLNCWISSICFGGHWTRMANALELSQQYHSVVGLNHPARLLISDAPCLSKLEDGGGTLCSKFQISYQHFLTKNELQEYGTIIDLE